MSGAVPIKQFTTAVALAALLAACGAQPQQAEMPPTQVRVIKAVESPTTLSDDLPGRVVALRTAEIRPQVSGIVVKSAFAQGSEVNAGQLLYQIDPATFRAEVNSAAATLKRAQATLANAQVQVDRLKPLVDSEAVSRQTYDNAVVARDQAEADVAQARAALERRQLDLRFASVTSPISGRIGSANVTEGALVGTSDAKAMATVQQIDQVYVDVRQPLARLEALRMAAKNGTATQGAEVEILDPSGQPLPTKGRLLFSDISIDPETGDAVGRVLIANPGRALLPGMFVRARLPRQTENHAIRLPQQAVKHDSGGQPYVNVVADKNKVAQRNVQLGDVVDGYYVVLGGLKSGEQVIVEGMDRVMPDATVKAVPWQPASAQK